jgi:formamidopyrimidine-DNA glycosylase
MVVNTLRPRILGRTITQVRLLRRDIVEPAGFDFVAQVQNCRVADIARRGKKIVFSLNGGHRFYIHLGMSGRLTVDDAALPVAKHTHLVLELDRGGEVRFFDPRRFGGVFWLGLDGAADAGLGPEPSDLTPAVLFAQLQRTRRVIKTALLDQKLIAGIGNIYADEALFAAGIHPRIPANALSRSQAARLCGAIKRTLNRALRHKGSTLRDYRDANGQPGDFQKLHRVYDRAGLPCWKCGGEIVREVIGRRSAHFCPVCQPERSENRA